MVLSPEGTIATVNRATCDLLGYPENELLGQPATLLFEEEEEEEEEEEDTLQSILTQHPLPVKRTVLRRLVKEGAVSNVEKSLRTKAGDRFPYSCPGPYARRPGRDSRNRVPGFGYSQAQASGGCPRAVNEEKYRRYVDDSPLGIFIIDATGRYMEVNPAACRMTGFSAEELPRMSIPELLAPDGLEEGLRHRRNW